MSSEHANSQPDHSPPTEQSRRDAVLERFRSSWRRGLRPNVADFVAQVAAGERDELLHELLKIDSRFRRDRGESPRPSDYLTMFPRSGAIIENAISLSAELTGPTGEGGTSRPGELAPGAGDSSGSQMPPAPSIPPLQPVLNSATVSVGSTLGPYELIETIGQGGMGTVYKARHQHLDKLVCVKVLPPQFTHEPESVLRFRREMKAVGRISHPHIVQAFDAGAIDGVHFLAMEYIAGTDLAQKVFDRGPLSIPNACRVIRQAALALAAAHQAGLVHRDVKPSNLLVTKAGQIKLLDLGLAKLGEDAATTSADFTAVGQAFGTPDYMAPEQWSDARSADARTDLYALGCTLFFVLTGRAPYCDEHHSAPCNKMTGHVTEPIPDLKTLRSDVPAKVLAIYRRLMAKSPRDRFQSAAELLKALESCPSNGPITATPAVLKRLRAGSSATKRQSPRRSASRKTGNRLRMTVAVAAICLPFIAGGTWWYLNPPFQQKSIEPAESRQTASVSQNENVDGSAVDANPTTAQLSPTISESDEATELEPARTEATVDSDPVQPSPDASEIEPIEPLFEQEQLAQPSIPGTWDVGPQPPWARGMVDYSLKDDDVLLGIVDQPRRIPGIRRWNVETVLPRARTSALGWSPDGQWIAIAAVDGHVRVYDATSLRLSHLFPGTDAARDVSWHPDSRRLALLADGGHAARVVDLDGQIHWETPLAGIGQAIAWNHAGTQLAISLTHNPRQDSPELEIRSVSGDLVKSLGHATRHETDTGGNESVAWSLDDSELIAAHADRKVRSWHIDTGQAAVISQFAGPSRLKLDFSRDGWLVVSNRETLKLYDAELKSVRQFDWPHERVKWHPDGRRVLCSGQIMALWDRDTDELTHNTDDFGSFSDTPWCWHPSGERCINGETFCSLKNGAELMTLRPPHRNAVQGKAQPYWSPDGKMFVTSHEASNNSLRLWNADGDQVGAWTGPTISADQPERLAWHPERDELLVADLHKLWLIKRDEAPSTFFDLKKKRLASVAWSPDGQFALAGLADGHLQVLERSGRLAQDIPTGSTSPVIIVAHAGTRKIAVATPGMPLFSLEFNGVWTLRSVGKSPLSGSVLSLGRPDGGLLRAGSPWTDAIEQEARHADVAAWRPDGQRYAAWGPSDRWSEMSVHDADGTVVRKAFFRSSIGPAWQPHGDRMLLGGTTIVALQEDDFHSLWHAVALPSGHAATFSAAGELLFGQPADVDAHLVYMIEREAGRIETMTPAQFRVLLPVR